MFELNGYRNFVWHDTYSKISFYINFTVHYYIYYFDNAVFVGIQPSTQQCQSLYIMLNLICQSCNSKTTITHIHNFSIVEFVSSPTVSITVHSA